MKIIETNIPDINTTDVDMSKLELAEKIINKIKPLLNEVNSDKIKQTEVFKKEILNNRKRIEDSKIKLEKLSKIYSCKKKQKKLLDSILKLNPSILLHDDQLKREIIILTKVINTLNNDKLDYHLIEIEKLNKRSF